MKGRRLLTGLVFMICLALLAAGAGLARRGSADSAVIRTIPLDAAPYVATSALPDLSHHRIFITAGDRLDVLDTTSGTILRTIHTGNSASSLIGTDGYHLLLMACCPPAGLRLLDTRSWRLSPPIPLGQSIPEVAIDTRWERAFLLDMDSQNSAGRLTIVDLRHNRLLRTLQIGLMPDKIAVDTQTGHVIATAFDGDRGWSAYMIDAMRGTLLRQTGLSAPPGAGSGVLAIDERAHRAFVTTPENSVIDVLDTRTGAFLRTISLGFAAGMMAVDGSRSRLFAVGSGPGNDRIAVLDTRSDTVMSVVSVGRVFNPPVLDRRDGLLFVYGTGPPSGGLVSVLDSRSGRLLRTTLIGAETGDLAVDEQRRQVLVLTRGPLDRLGDLTGPGNLSVFDARSGRLLRTIPVGVSPVSLSVDTRAGRAVVVNEGGRIAVPDRWAWVPGWLRHVLPVLAPPPQPALPCMVYVPQAHPSAACQTVQGSITLIALVGASGTSTDRPGR